MAISEKQKDCQTENLTTSVASQVVNLMPTQCATRKRESCESDDILPSVINNPFQLDWIHENVWMRQYKQR